jgi:HSP90 family molecular chaperone
MNENQKIIYYITGESKEVVTASAFVERLKELDVKTSSLSPRKVWSMPRMRRRSRRSMRTNPTLKACVR